MIHTINTTEAEISANFCQLLIDRKNFPSFNNLIVKKIHTVQADRNALVKPILAENDQSGFLLYMNSERENVPAAIINVAGGGETAPFFISKQ